ncbi:MAG TPA: hypothetical protein VMT85_24805 [Thermoanaerobaculia bacterium]|nr:hypothetical protein [Thermoanaerobaculia bacterium]
MSRAFAESSPSPATPSVGEEIYYSKLTDEREGLGPRGQGRGAEPPGAARSVRRPARFRSGSRLERVEAPGPRILGALDRSIPIPETVERLDALIAAGNPYTPRVLPGVGHGMRDLQTGAEVPVAAIAVGWLEGIRSRPAGVPW